MERDTPTRAYRAMTENVLPGGELPGDPHQDGIDAVKADDAIASVSFEQLCVDRLRSAAQSGEEAFNQAKRDLADELKRTANELGDIKFIWISQTGGDY